MARSINEIYQQIIDEKNSLALIKDALAPTSAQVETLELQLAELNSRSRVAMWRLLAFVIAVCTWISEKLRDIMIIDIEALIYRSGMGTPLWLRQKVLEFQYDEVTPQNLLLNTQKIEYYYPVVDASKRVVSRCSVKRNNDGNTIVLVATAEPPSKLEAGPVSALRFYLEQINFCSRKIVVQSSDPDRLYVNGIVKINPFYATVIEQAVQAAILKFCQDLSAQQNFGGAVVVSKFEAMILAIEGVLDFKLQELSIRAADTPFANRTRIYALSSGINLIQASTTSGYVLPENEAGQTITDTGTIQYI